MTGKDWYVGTSGFMVPKNIWLDLPGLNCIEMNSTFYALPSATTVKNWKNLSDNLYFSIKCSKFITHMKRLNDCKTAWNKFYNRIKPLDNKIKSYFNSITTIFQIK